MNNNFHKAALDATPQSAHTFHIPVMGTGFTIDTPLKVAQYGIDSVISLVDDVLVEQMREYYSKNEGLDFQPITTGDPDSRARRFTAYLNLVYDLVQKQFQELKASPFEEGSEITRYFELLPNSLVKGLYHKMLNTKDPGLKANLQAELRQHAVPGSIDVNILTKLDRRSSLTNTSMAPENSLTMASLRGFAMSKLSSSIVLSAGLNKPLFEYFNEFPDFFPDQEGRLKKRITIKVSDYRSALIQGKLLAKEGLWVSEFRVESGLNCGGHAFGAKGFLLGPILNEFKANRQEMQQLLVGIYTRGLTKKGLPVPENLPQLRITAQGGIGTADEDRLLREHFGVDKTGWATPFLLVPEVTAVDATHIEKLKAATPRDVYLSDSSPLGVPFWNLRNSGSEEKRRERIRNGRSGSPCKKGFAASNMEFSDTPMCVASSKYQSIKLKELSRQELSEEEHAKAVAKVQVKSCICHDLAGSATRKYEIDGKADPAICCGPSIAYFLNTATLEAMLGHIYGKLSLLAGPRRPHMFINELKLNIAYFRKSLASLSSSIPAGPRNEMAEFRQNLLAGIEYYRSLVNQIAEDKRQRFLDDLNILSRILDRIPAYAYARTARR